MYRTLPSARQNVRLSTKRTVKAVRYLSNSRIVHAEGSTSSSAPPQKRRIFRRLFIYTASLIAGIYASSPFAAFNNERFYDFFYESAPFGATILEYAESQDWDRTLSISFLQPGKRYDPKKVETVVSRPSSKDASKPNELAKTEDPSAQNEAKITKTMENSKEKSKEKSTASQTTTKSDVRDSKEKAKKAAAEARAIAQKQVADIKEGIKETEATVKDKAKNITSEVGGSAAIAAVQQLPAKFSEELALLVQEVEAVLNEKSISDSRQAVTSPASTTTPDTNRSHDVTKVPLDGEKEKKEDRVYNTLPVGFEPPPGYSKAKPPSSTSEPIGLLNYPPLPNPGADKLPELTRSIGNLSTSEPVVGHIASTIDELASLLNSSPLSFIQAREVLDGAKSDLVKLLERIEKAREEGRTKLEAQLDEQAREYSLKLLETELAAQDKLNETETGFKEAFEEEKQKFLKYYREKLDNELKVQSELIDERLRQELIAQSIQLQRQWLRDLKIFVEQERGGRLAKLDQIATKMKQLERITLDNTEYLDENIRIHTLWTALRALANAVNSPVRRPFRDELRALRHIPAAQSDPLITTALESIEATDISDIGIDPFSDLATWFTTSVSPQVSRVALVPEQDAGFLSHVASHLFSYLQFRRHGLVEGNDVLSILARAEYRLNEKDLDGATRELNQLKGASGPLLQDWLEAARRRLEVLQAIEVMEMQAMLSSLLIV